MKKIVTLATIALFCAGTIAFADDAKVMPAKVGRVYMTNTYAFANGSYDKDGKYTDYASGAGAFKAYNMGFALEYGVIDWVTAAIQWAPGVNVWSDMDKNLGTTATANINGFYDIFAGAKFQIVGEKAPIKNSMIRFAVAPGVKIPLPAVNMQDQYNNILSSSATTVANMDKHLFALGGRGYFDYILNKMFFFNLYSEFIYYPLEGDLKDLSPTYHASTSKVAFGYKLTLEAEPHFEAMVADGLQFSAGLPITYVTTPDIKIDGTASADSSTAVINLGPNASVFFLKALLPVELKLGYSFPVYAVNTPATNSLTLQAKVYFKL